MTLGQPRVGNDAALLYNYAGTYDTPAWVEVLGCGNVNISTLEVSMAEVVTRNGDWAANLAAKFRAEVEFQYLWGEDTAVLDNLIDDFWSRNPIDVAVMDVDFTVTPNTGEGLRGNFFIASMPRNEPNEEAIMVDGFRLVPALEYSDQGTYKDKINASWYAPEATTFAAGIRGPIPFNVPRKALKAFVKKNGLDPLAVQKAVKNSKFYVDHLETVAAREAAGFYPDFERMHMLANAQPYRPVVVSKWMLEKKIRPGQKETANFYPTTTTVPVSKA